MKVTYIERSPRTWRLRIESGVGPDGRRLFKYETLRGTLDDVRRRRFAILNEHDQGTFAEPSKLTFGSFFTQWFDTRLALKKITRSTAENYDKMLRYYLGTIAGRRLQRITAQDIQAIYTAMAKRGDLSQNTLHHVHAIVGAAFRAARRAKIIKVNVMEEIEAPAKQRARPRSLTEAQAAKLLASLEGSWMEPVGVTSTSTAPASMSAASWCSTGTPRSRGCRRRPRPASARSRSRPTPSRCCAVSASPPANSA